jgi:hypothetical protein
LLSIPSTRSERIHLVEETDDLSSNVLATGLLVVHDTSRGGEDDISELTRGEKLDNPLLEVTELDVVAGGDDTSLVETIFRQSVLYPTTSVWCGKGTNRPLSWTTILPERWSSISSNSPM